MPCRLGSFASVSGPKWNSPLAESLKRRRSLVRVARSTLGMLLRAGLGERKVRSDGRSDLVSQAADQGHRRQLTRWVMRICRKWCAQGRGRSGEWFQLAAEKDHFGAQLALARCYEHGHGLGTDTKDSNNSR